MCRQTNNTKGKHALTRPSDYQGNCDNPKMC